MAEGIRIIEEFLDGEENFEGFDLEDLETSRNAQNNLDDRNNNVLDENLWERGDRVPQNLTFSGQHGLLKDIDNTDSPIDIFELFLENDDFEQIANETKKYAAQFLEGKHWKTSLAFKNGERPLCQKWRSFLHSSSCDCDWLVDTNGCVGVLDCKSCYSHSVLS